MAKVSALGHVGLYVSDLQRSKDFYTRVLGLQVTDEDAQRGMVFLSSRPQEEHHELLLMKGRHAPGDVLLLQQLSFRAPSLAEVKALHRRFKAEGVTIQRVVNHGVAVGVYFLDPDGNILEVYYRTGFQVPQPYGEPVDLEASDDKILERARALVPVAR